MSVASTPPNQFRSERSRYTFRLLDPATTNGHCVIQAKPEPDSSIRWNPDCPSDSQFNLSAMIGNDNACFKWGRYAFERSGCNFKLVDEPGTCACLLTGKLVDLNGEYKDAFINIDERLKVEEYIDVGTNEIYHRLTGKDNPAPEVISGFLSTGNELHKTVVTNTNVVKLVELLKKDDPSKQMTGVGTYSPPGMLTSAGLAIASKLDEAVAWLVIQLIQLGIALFGFSRGAFTARALAGMLHSNGKSHTKTPANTAFSTTTKASARKVDPAEFKRTFCIPITVDYVGVWDTVASVVRVHDFLCSWADLLTRYTRQALALDERRGNFIPSVWDHRRTTIVQDVKEVWFKGEHSDVGGGSSGSENNNHNMLSNITLRWMVRQTIECGTGILFDHAAIELYRKRNILEIPSAEGPRPGKDWMKRLAESRKLDQVDIKQGIYDSIGWSLLWNGLEYFAFTFALTDPAFARCIYRPHAKAGREIFRFREKDPIYLHSSVVDQLASYGPVIHKRDYQPRARWYGYGKQEWPRIEDVSPSTEHGSPTSGARIPEDAKLRLNMVRHSASKKRQAQFCAPILGGLIRGFKGCGARKYHITNIVEPFADPQTSRALTLIDRTDPQWYHLRCERELKSLLPWWGVCIGDACHQLHVTVGLANAVSSVSEIARQPVDALEPAGLVLGNAPRQSFLLHATWIYQSRDMCGHRASTSISPLEEKVDTTARRYCLTYWYCRTRALTHSRKLRNLVRRPAPNLTGIQIILGVINGLIDILLIWQCYHYAKWQQFAAMLRYFRGRERGPGASSAPDQPPSTTPTLTAITAAPPEKSRTYKSTFYHTIYVLLVVGISIMVWGLVVARVRRTANLRAGEDGTDPEFEKVGAAFGWLSMLIAGEQIMGQFALYRKHRGAANEPTVAPTTPEGMDEEHKENV
ncbi:CVNH domain-containing protein [Rhizoctonia solani AG-1 IA]|uniref:CVNH domain-containing protein n=1 Tax=Thanatephorus cucumeris (strain AG1-IA) TaxID=983506 RepID=L8WGZ2_THACA|nr:CVNH domain-containing protein [Rhizoctonia solani AG-1 IA]